MRETISRDFAKQCVGAGWHGLVEEAFDAVEAERAQVIQVKEKFGQLRIYLISESEELYKKIYEIEERSSTICETCGAPGKNRSRGGWLRTICNPCLEMLDVRFKTGK